MEITDELAGAARNGREVDLTGGPALDAELLVELLSGDRPVRAVRIRGARISGELDLGALTIGCPLALEECVFDGWVRLTETQAKSISLRAGRIRYLRADDLRTSGVLDLAKAEIGYVLNLSGAHVGRDLSLNGARLGPLDKTSLLAMGLEVEGNLHARELSAEGLVDLTDATIGGHLDLGAARLRNPGDRALTADGLRVGTFLQADGLVADGAVFLSRARIGAELVFDDARLSDPDGFALSADLISVAQDLSFRDGFASDGPLRLVGARIGGRVVVDGSVTTREHPAFVGDGISVDGDLEFRASFEADGEVRLFEGRVGHKLRFIGKSSVPAGGTALDLTSVRADVLELGNREPFQGSVVLFRTRVREFFDVPESWAPELVLFGFEYETLRNDSVSVRDRLSWLRRDPLPRGPETIRAQRPGVRARRLLAGRARADRRPRPEEGVVPAGAAQVWSWVFTGAGWVLTTAVVAGVTNALKRD